MYSRMGHTGAGHEGAGQPAPSFDLSALSREELETYFREVVAYAEQVRALEERIRQS